MTDPAPNDEYHYSARFYDFVDRYQARADLDFYLEAARSSGGPVLELGCGTGRVLIPTARAGIRITGLDGSPAMLAVCRENVAREEPPVRERIDLVAGDMRCFDLGGKFALVTVPFRPFQHLLTVEDQLACLECVRRHLVPGGVFILDVFNPWLEALVADDVGRDAGPEVVKDLPDGRRVVRHIVIRSKDRANQVIHSDILYHVTHPDGRTETLSQPLTMRYLFRFEAEHLLERSGLHVMHVYGDYDKSEFGKKNPGELILAARAD